MSGIKRPLILERYVSNFMKTSYVSTVYSCNTRSESFISAFAEASAQAKKLDISLLRVTLIKRFRTPGAGVFYFRWLEFVRRRNGG